MTLGTSRPRNGGIDQQVGMLLVTCLRSKVCHRIRQRFGVRHIELAISHDGETPLSTYERRAEIVHVRRNVWEVRSYEDGRALSRGSTERNAIRNFIDERVPPPNTPSESVI